MFPPQLVHYFIRKHTLPGDIVADLWAGVGTVSLEACLTGRFGIGNDVSPEAYTIIRAKLDPPRQDMFMEYLGELRSRVAQSAGSVDKLGIELGVREYYHPLTLKEVLATRRVLEIDEEEGRRRRFARFATALMLGMVHGDRSESLSLPLDSSKATSVRHIIAKQKANPGQYTARYKNVVDALFLKAAKVFRDYVPEYHGRALNQDAASVRLQKKVKLFVTSPPYLDVHTYAYDNRIRLWFLGVDYRKLRKKLFSTCSVDTYVSHIVTSLKHVEEMLDRNGACVLVVGDVRVNGKHSKPRTLRLGEIIADCWLDSGNKEMRLERVVVDRIKTRRRRYFNLQKQHGIKTERILEFRTGKAFMREPRIDWDARVYPGALYERGDQKYANLTT